MFTPLSLFPLLPLVTQQHGLSTTTDAIPNSPDLDAYFDRIGYAGPRAPTLDVLRAIVRHHTEAIAFENLNPLLQWPVQLDIASLQQKMVKGGRGGYCFEHNLLLKHVMEALGFRVTGLAARVLWNGPEDAINPRSHMLLHVDLDGAPYVVDVGFGGATLTAPLRLEPGIEQATPHEPFRLVGADDNFVMQARIREAWKSLYRFDLQEQHLPDYEVTNWYFSHHPDSHFVNGLIAARAAPERRYTLRNNELAVQYLDGRTERCVLTSVAALRETLEGPLGLTLPDDPELDDVLERLIASEARPA